MSTHVRKRRRSRARVVALPLPSRSWVVACAVILLLAVASYTGFRMFAAVRSVDSHATLGDIVALAQNNDVPGSLAYRLKHGDRVNILLLGYGGAGHDGAYLTDSIMVLSAQGTDRIAMTSIPRDTDIKVTGVFANGGTYQGRINAVFAMPLDHGIAGKPLPQYDTGFDGAGKLASKVVGDLIGEPIDYYVGVDFTAFQKMVDAVGGVDVVNPYALDDSTYPKGENGATMHIHFDPGPLHLDGTQALIYVRERHSDNDFGRSRRQQQVLAAVKEKAQNPAVVLKLFGLLDALQGNIKTNLKVTDLKAAAGLVNRINTKAAHHVSLDATNFLYEPPDEALFYRLLLRDKTKVTLQHFIDNELPDPRVLAENAKIEFESNASQANEYNSLAGVETSLFHMINFQTTAPGADSHAPATTEIHDYSGGRDSKTVSWLARFFGVTPTTETPVAATGATGPGPSPSPDASGNLPGPPDVVVVLGRDFSSQYDQREQSAYIPTYGSGSSGGGTYGTPKPRASATAAPRPSPSQSAAPAPSPTVKPSPTVCIPPACKSPPPNGGGGNGGGGGPSPTPTASPPAP